MGKNNFCQSQNSKYLTISEKSRVNYKVKDSKFIGTALPCDNRSLAENLIEKIKNEFSDASHNAFAFRIFLENEIREFSDDDGEPNDSAGPPILQRIKGEDLLNTAVVVTRYFGGTKLGIGGLIKAYGGTASEALRKAEKKQLKLYNLFYCRGEYDILGDVLAQLEKFSANIKNNNHKQGKFELEAEIYIEIWEDLKQNLKLATGDTVELEVIKNYYL